MRCEVRDLPVFMVHKGLEIHVTVKQNVPVPYRKLVENIVVLYGTQAKQVYVPYGKHCTESTIMQQPNPVQAMCNMVDSVQQGSALIISKEEGIKYWTTKAVQWVGRMIFYRQSHCDLDFIKL